MTLGNKECSCNGQCHKDENTKCERCGIDLKDTDIKEYVIPSNNNGGEDSCNNRHILLCEHCFNKMNKEVSKSIYQFVGLSHFKKAAKEIFLGLQEMGLDIDDVNFKDTPERVGRAYYEIFQGVENTDEEVQKILSTGFPSDGMNNMITACGITAFSMCPHHLLPVEYKINVGYVPDKDGNVLGISKLSRLVRLLAKRPVLQEKLGEDIVEALMSIGAQGAACCIAGRHMCMRMRGVKDPTATVHSQSMRGCFKDDINCRNEFLLTTKEGLKFN